LDGNVDEWQNELLGWLRGARGPLQQATAADAATWLPDDLLVKLDRMTMAHSIEGRAPYLAPALAEIAVNLPAAERMAHGRSKIALRRIAGQYLPDDVVGRRKQGFVLPMRAWLEDWFGSRGSPVAYVAACAVPLLDSAALAQLIGRDLAAGVRRERLLFAIAMLLEWWQSFAARRTRLVASMTALRSTQEDSAFSCEWPRLFATERPAYSDNRRSPTCRSHWINPHGGSWAA
jgi:asparagine synthase (glutamine-hydrolysing)